MARGRGSWRLAAGVVAAAVAASGAIAWLRANVEAAGPGNAMVMAALDDETLELLDADSGGGGDGGGGGGEARLTVDPIGGEGRVVGAGRGRALLLGAATTQLVRLDADAELLGPGGLDPAGPWSILGPHRVRGVILGPNGAADLVVDLETGRTSVLADLVERPGATGVVTSYATDASHATVVVAGETWLVRITGEQAARRLDATWAGFSGTGAQLAELRTTREGAHTLHLLAAEGGLERQLWAGADIVLAAWAGSGIVLVDPAGVTLVDAADGAAVQTIDVPVDPASIDATRATLAVDGDGRWWRLDDTGEEVPELRGLVPLAGGHPLADRVVFARAGADPVVAAWDLRAQVVRRVTGTPEQLSRLAKAASMQSPDGRYLATVAPVLLADLAGGEVVDRADVERAGAFAPDGSRLVVATNAGLALLRPSDLTRPAEPLGVRAAAGGVEAGWVYP